MTPAGYALVPVERWEIRLFAALYQACGAFDMPVRILDALSIAQHGGKPDDAMIDSLLPCMPDDAPPPIDVEAERVRFEVWYSCSAFNYGSNPIGSRQCDLQWRAWQCAIGVAEPKSWPGWIAGKRDARGGA